MTLHTGWNVSWATGCSGGLRGIGLSADEMTAPTQQRLVPLTTGRTDLVTMVLATWLMIGLFLDGYAHTNLIDELESFFTPWHAVFYSGFLASSAWVAWIIYKNVVTGHPLRTAIPGGYGPTVLGLTIFALGGIGDGIWHTIFGVEAGIDALLSPTHFLMFLGGVLGLSTAIRTTRLRNMGESVASGDSLPLLISLLLITAAMAFFVAYVWIPGQPTILEVPYSPASGDGQGAVGYFISGMLVSTTVLLAPLIIVLRWWRPPVGTVALVWVLVNAAIALSFDLHFGVALVFGLTGGAVGEAVRVVLKPGPSNRVGSLALMTAVPVAAWSGFIVAYAVVGSIAWPPEIWVGSVILSGLAGAGLGWISLPDPVRGPS